MDNFKLAFGVFVIVALIYLGVTFVPPYYENYEFQDAISHQALDSTYTPQTEDDIRDAVYRTAEDIGVPVTKEQIQVTRLGGQANGSITINVPYVVHISLPGYPYDLRFDASSSNHSTF
jgi:hypothetical protein